MEYSAKVLEHFANPHNVGKIDDADGIGEVGNAKCGDIMKMYIKVKDDVITDVKFNTYGCASAIATSSIATDMIKGKPISEALKLTNKAVVEALDGLPAVKIHCSVLAEEAIKAAVKDYYDKNGIQYDEELLSPIIATIHTNIKSDRTKKDCKTIVLQSFYFLRHLKIKPLPCRLLRRHRHHRQEYRPFATTA